MRTATWEAKDRNGYAARDLARDPVVLGLLDEALAPTDPRAARRLSDGSAASGAPRAEATRLGGPDLVSLNQWLLE